MLWAPGEASSTEVVPREALFVDLGLQEKWAGGPWASQWWGPEGPREVEPQTQGPQTPRPSSTQGHGTLTRPRLLSPNMCGVTAQVSGGLPTPSASWSESLGLPAPRVGPPELWPPPEEPGEGAEPGGASEPLLHLSQPTPSLVHLSRRPPRALGNCVGAGQPAAWGHRYRARVGWPSFPASGLWASHLPGQEQVPARGAHVGSHTAQSSAHMCVHQDHTGPSR